MQALEKQLISQFQKLSVISLTPYQAIARELGVSESDIINSLQQLTDNNILSRFGPVFNHSAAGASTLVTLAVPTDELDTVAEKINQYPEVNHNYARDHYYNLWFVVTAYDQDHLIQVINQITQDINLTPLVLPMEKAFYIDLAFPINWDS
ncbi:Lrp/AsnC family transcriptional regulator [Endozoicomonas sp. SM1973]|uniref:siroheme decarboxylase n=1 Tax=Spartinivicinus marinus TaxID=2994442 RepID=A0A853I1L2_9GAMM|nr:Lrp/AsnC family transcriptional regulator [Spartinivicinus marinus]MCX4024846.1 Lrp/AsnC family transcriptional regulator [Spartinivicinus marinus]NYZ66509.1 Lrp/AsnC family transcriptional regulator [Spartinivicinus marinus]